MKVIIGGVRKDVRTLWLEGSVLRMINQPLLPYRFEIFESKDYRKTAGAIRTMVVRGAPAIGAAGAFGMAQAAVEFKGNSMDDFRKHMKEAERILSSTRPTAYDLFHGIKTVMDGMADAKDVGQAKKYALSAANQYADWSANNCRLIGEFGEKLIKDGCGILTHCNAGALACVDYGTALAPIRLAHQNGKKIHVFVDETRPRLQGANLTAWEMVMEGISHSLIADNASGHFMRTGDVDIVIVGADRVAANGDIANKIGTYEKAVLAKENGIPFYVAAPSSTIDFACHSGDKIPIEERPQDEVLYVSGLSDSKKTERVRIAPAETTARNPAFDYTPAKYITGIITEKGLFRPKDVKSMEKSMEK